MVKSEKADAELRQRHTQARDTAIDSGSNDSSHEETENKSVIESKRSKNAHNATPILGYIISAVLSAIITLAVLWSNGKIGAPVRYYAHYSTFMATPGQEITATAQSPTPFEPVPWIRAPVAPWGVGACVPPVVPESIQSQIVQFRGRGHRGLISSKHSKNMPLLRDLAPIWVLDGVNVGIHTASKSSPIVERDATTGQSTLYVGSDNGRLYAVDASTGVVRWIYSVRPAHFGIHGTPAVDDMYVYITSYSGWMSALHKSNGTMVWETQVGHSIGASPVLVGERVCSGIELNRPRANGYVACLARRTGQVLFYSHALNDHTHGTPTFVWKIGPTKEDWSTRVPAAISSAKKTKEESCTWKEHCSNLLKSSASPQFDQKTLTEFEHTTCALSSPTFEQEWSRSSAERLNSIESDLREEAGPYLKGKHGAKTTLTAGTLASGLILIGSNTGVLSGLDSITGKRLWKFTTFGSLARPILLKLQKERKEMYQQAKNRVQTRKLRREREYNARLEQAILEKSSTAAGSKWSTKDREAFDRLEAARKIVLDEGEKSDLSMTQDTRDQDNPDVWVKEDTAEFCERAPEFLCSNKEWKPWLWLLNNKENGNQGQIKGTIATSGNIAVFVSWDSFAYGIDINDGKLLWSFQTKSLGMASASILPQSAWDASVTSKSHGIAFIGTHEWAIYALDLSTGKLIWRYATGAKVMSSGVLTQRGDLPIVRETCGEANTWVLTWGAFDSVVYELCASNGILLSKRSLHSGAISNEVAIRDSTIFVSTNGGKVIALRAP